MEKPKSRVFKDLYPLILQMKKEGYTDATINNFLRENHSLDISLGTFTNYLFRLRKRNIEPAVSEIKKTPVIPPKVTTPSSIPQNTVKTSVADSLEQPVKKRLTLADIQNGKTEEELRDERIRNITKKYIK